MTDVQPGYPPYGRPGPPNPGPEYGRPAPSNPGGPGYGPQPPYPPGYGPQPPGYGPGYSPPYGPPGPGYPPPYHQDGPGHPPPYPPPYGPPPQPQPPALDRAAADLRRRDPRPWGAGVVVIPLVATVAVILGGQLLAYALRDVTGPVRTAFGVGVNIGAEFLLLGAVYLAGRSIAARYGGWRTTFGLDRPRGKDAAPAAIGFAVVFAARMALGIVAAIATRGRAAAQAQNVHLNSVTPAAVITLFVAAVVLAPVMEELAFRGLLLRTFMRRMSFWPAALLSTLIFALFHVYEVATVTGAVVLALNVGLLGLGNCYLNRVTDRLAPGMIVHSASNALALVVAIAVT